MILNVQKMKKRVEDLVSRCLSEEKFGHLRIPLEDIKLATNNFSPENVITLGTYETVYKGEIGENPVTVRVKVQRLVNNWDLALAEKNIRDHPPPNPNILSFLGLCSEDDKIIYVFEHSAYGSLQDYLDNTILTWKKRLQICIGAARGFLLFYDAVPVRKISSSSIFLDTNWEAKVSHTYDTTAESDSESRIEKYAMAKQESVYSFGIVLFEVLCGRLAFDTDYDSDCQEFIKLAVESVEDRKLDEIIMDPFLKFQMSPDSLRYFADYAFRCCRPRNRSLMSEILRGLEWLARQHCDDGVEGIPMVQDDNKSIPISFYKEKNLEHWIIPWKEIYSATSGFSNDHLIGGGGFGGVYKAKLFHFDVRKYFRKNGSLSFSTGRSGFGGYPRRRSTVAIKKLDDRTGQGKTEFLQEIEVLSTLKHPNLVSLLGFCDHDGDMILVYEHASYGSLDETITMGTTR